MYENLFSVSITAPSGGGKGTTVSRIMEKNPNDCILSKSCTTRSVVEGEWYDPISREEFQKRILEGYFFEYEEVSGNFYGTPKHQLEQAEKENKILLLDVDVNGATRFKKLLKNNLFVFIDSGDDIEVYKQRILLRKREVDTKESIKKRISRVPYELQLGRFECHFNLTNLETKEVLIQKTDQILIPKILEMRTAAIVF